MRAVKHSSYVAASHLTQPHRSHEMDALLLVAESGKCPDPFDRRNLLMLCAVMRDMSAKQRVLLVNLLAKSFAAATSYVPVDAQQILATAELPPVLERVAGRIHSSQTWLAWTDSRRTWFMVAEMANDRGRVEDAATIRILFHDEDGEHVAAGTWAFSPRGKWRLDSVHALDAPSVVMADTCC